MKKIALLCLLLATLHARADVIMVQKVEETIKSGTDSTSQIATITTKIKGDKSRTDISSDSALPDPTLSSSDSSRSSIIADAGTGDIITLVHESKNFIRLSAGKTKSLVDEIQKSKTAALAPPKIIDTGKTEKVGNYITEIYTAQAGSAKYTFWVTKDFPDFSNLQQQMRKFQVRQADLKRTLGMQEDLSPDVWTLDGMVVKTIIITQTHDEKGVPALATTIMTLVTARNQPVDDADFQVPSDYIEMEPPATPPAPALTPTRQYHG